MKKALILVLCGGIIATGVVFGKSLSSPKENIKLTLDSNKLVWENNSDVVLKGSEYRIYNGEYLVSKFTGNNFHITKEKLLDEIGPDKPGKITMNYKNNGVVLEWEEINDVGSDNSIQVALYNNKNKMISYSNSVNINYASGLDKYVIEFNGKAYELKENKFNLSFDKIDNGVTYLKLYAVDSRGNKGNAVNIPVYNYKVILSEENGDLRFHIDDNSQEYLFKVYVDGEAKDTVKNSEELKALLRDSNAPEEVKNVEIKNFEDYVRIRWKDATDKEKRLKVKIESYGLSYYNTSVSDELETKIGSGVKGYHYAINNMNKYEVTKDDRFTAYTEIEYSDNFGDYYLHIASVDNEGNISATQSHKFKIKDENKDTSSDNKPQNGQIGNISGGNTTNGNTSNGNSSNGNSSNGNVNINIGNNNNNNGSNNADVNSQVDSKVKESTILSMINIVGNVSGDSKEKAVKLLSNLSWTTISSLKNNNIKIYLTSGEAEDTYKILTGTSTSSITGAFVWGNGTNAVICETSYIDSTLIHEVGHAYDYVLGKGSFISNKKEFVSIYNSERDYLFSGNKYIYDTVNEYFAETFLIYHQNNTLLRTKAPKTYEFLKNKIK